MVGAIVHPATAGGAEEETQGPPEQKQVTSWFEGQARRPDADLDRGADRRVRRAVLGLPHVPAGAGRTEAPTQAVVPPGFVPDPNYTWVPRTNVRRPKEPDDHHHDHDDARPRPRRRPDDDHQPDVADPTTTVVDPDGPAPAGPQTVTQTPTPTPTTPPAPGPGPAPDHACCAEIARPALLMHRYTGVP